MVVLVLVALGAAGGGRAWQEQQGQGAQQAQRPPAFRAGVNYVRVDAYPAQNGQIVPDLTAADFELVEDGVSQRIEQCEFVRARPGAAPKPPGPGETVASARVQAGEPRARVFVLFLDAYHVGVAGSHRMRTALPAFLRRVLGPEDVVGLMAPWMEPSSIALTRRTEAIEDMLEREWAWGQRDRPPQLEPEEANFEACYPERAPEITCVVNGRETKQPANFYTGVARELVERRRERISLDALTGLVDWLHGAREERKAVLTVSDGWRLFQPDRSITRLGICDQEFGPASTGYGTPIRPGGGGLRGGAVELLRSCEPGRQALAALDNARAFRDLLDRANRANVSFYPVDPRGLPAFDTSMADTKMSQGGVTQPLLTPAEDGARLTSRIESLRTLAAATDGMAVVNSNDIDSGLRRIEADMASYYLLGYYSTNTKLDGKFRAITVRARRPGVQVRARRGYLAPTQMEVAAAMAAAAASRAPESAAAAGSGPSAGAARSPVAEALVDLTARPSPIRTRVAWLAGTEGSGGVRAWWVVELDSALVREDGELAGGAEIAATAALASSGAQVFQRRARLAAGDRAVAFDFAIAVPDPGGLILRVRARPVGGAGTPIAEAVRVRAPAGAWPVGTARLFRRSPGANSEFTPTADLRYSRTERLRIEVPAAGAIEAVSGALLDRMGAPLKLPVACATRAADVQDAAWAACDLTLAPLAAGDYGIGVVVTTNGRRHEVVTAFRVQ